MLISSHILNLRVFGTGHSLVDKWLGLCSSTAGSMDSFPGGEIRCHKPRGATKRKKARKILGRKTLNIANNKVSCLLWECRTEQEKRLINWKDALSSFIKNAFRI